MTKDSLASSIHEIIKDYRNQDGIYITQEDIIDWSEQFQNESSLILSELNKILLETYVSRQKAKEFISRHIYNYLKIFNTNICTFLQETEFLDVQPALKSQPAILLLLEEVLEEEFQESYVKYKDFPKINFIYFDDILASGSTIGRDLITFFEKKDKFGKPFHQKLLDNEIKVLISLFCIHTWGFEFLKYRILKKFDGKVVQKLQWYWNYEIQNHGKFNNQRLNIAKPVKENNYKINSYLEKLSATKYEDYAYRK